MVYCIICHHESNDNPPKPGNSVVCPECGSIGYGTYDDHDNYMIEWYEQDE